MKKLVLASAAILLASCAPTQTGNGASRPQILESYDDPVNVTAGGTHYVQLKYPSRLLPSSKSHFDNLKINFSDRHGTNVRTVIGPANFLMMEAKNLPEGVNVSMSEAYIVKEITDTTESGNVVSVQYFEYFRVVLKISVAKESALSGNSPIKLTYKDGTSSVEVPLELDARKTINAFLNQ